MEIGEWNVLLLERVSKLISMNSFAHNNHAIFDIEF